MTVHAVDDYAGAMAVLKNPHMHQALYDEGSVVMADVLLTLHGEAHQRRRIAEFSVFGRGFFRHYEREVFPATLQPVLEPHLNTGEADLVDLCYRVVMNLTADFAGLDRDDTPEETATLLGLVKTFSAGATLAHSTQDRAAVRRRVEDAMAVLDNRFLQRSIARRRALLAAGADLPNDILATLLAKADRVPLDPDVLRREIAFYLQAGAHSTANATVHAFDELCRWCSDDISRREQLTSDRVLLQRAVHESLRLHPASPVAQRRATEDATIDRHSIAAGDLVVVDLARANRDPAVFGADADRFDPGREIPQGTWPFGLTFGYGTHACLGRDLDGGVAPKTSAEPAELQMGIVPMLVHTLLKHGAAPIAGHPPQKDANTTREHFATYPIAFGARP